MGNLIITLVGLGIFVYYCLAGLGYINPDIFSEINDEYSIDTGISSLNGAILEYDLINSEYPTLKSELVNGGYIKSIPEFTNNVDLDEFTSTESHVFYFCLSGDNITESEFNTYNYIIERKYDGSLVHVTDCDTGTEASDPESFPASAIFRYNYN